LLAGGGGQLQELGHTLEDRLFEMLTGDIERVEVGYAVVYSGYIYCINNCKVVTARRDPLLDSRSLSWRGGAVAASLENSKDMWILRNEWQFTGVSLLRERLPFAWA
jgi:actin-related protein